MKKYIYTGVLLLGILGASAQSKETRKADKHFNNLAYADAIEEYLEVVADGHEDGYVQGRLADAYYNTANTQAAARWYKKALANSKNTRQHFAYAQALKANGSYTEAAAAMDAFAALAPQDLRAIAHANNRTAATDLLGAAPKFSVQVVDGFNSKYSDFGPLLHNGKVYYTSAKSDGKKYGWNNEPYLDIYSADYDAASGSLTNETALAGKINTKYNEGTVSFSPDGKTMYFSGENVLRNGGLFKKRFIKDAGGKSTINLFKASLVNGEWKNITALPFNGKNHSTGGPAVSLDGSRLYFSSDMEGSLGGSDIWYASIHADGSYGNPVNLGKDINTEGSEMFPYISSKNTLYFSSNGHPGLGMLDVFAVQIKGDSFGSLRNAGAPINSGSDDFSFSIDEALQKGFVASNRAGGTGSDDIYAFDKIAPICDVALTVQVADRKDGAILAMADVVIYNANNEVVANRTTNENGEIQFNYACDQAFKVVAAKELYTENSVAVEKTDAQEVSAQVLLDKIPEVIVLNPIFFDLDKHAITEQGTVELDKLVAIMASHPTMIVKVQSHTDARGNDAYNMKLSVRRVKATVEYVISKGIHAHRIFGSGMGETQLVNDCGNNADCAEEAHQANRRSEFIIVPE